MNFFYQLGVVFFCAWFPFMAALAQDASAVTSQAVPKPVYEAVSKITASKPGDAVIRPSKIPGIYEVQIQGQILYVGERGDFFILGELIKADTMENLTRASQKRLRAKTLAKLDRKQTVRFIPRKTKYIVYAFTDVDCFYCRKFHKNIQAMLDAGIEVRYLFAPFQGPAAMERAEGVWCARDRPATMTKAKKGERIDLKKCPNPIEQHLKLVQQFQVRGTPYLVLSNGHEISGFVEPQQLLQAIEQEKIQPLS